MVNLKAISHIFLIVASITLLSGCFNTRFLKDGEVLFKKNKVTIQSTEKIEKEGALKTEVADISLLQANKKVLGIAKVRLWFYNVASRRRETKFRYWMKNKIGEPPALYDSILVMKSVDLIENYMINQGYFYATVRDSVHIKRKKAVVEYIVTPGPLYRIRSFEYPVDTSRISTIIQQHQAESKIKEGVPFRVSDLKEERDRISDNLRNNGYYYFNKEYVTFDIDSNDVDHTLGIKVRVNPPSDSTQHKVYHINTIYVYTDYTIEQSTRSVRFDTIRLGEYVFISEKLRFRTELLTSSIHFERNKLFSKQDYAVTINQLADLGVFKFINIKFEPDTLSVDGKNYLNCFVTLTPAKRQEWGVDAELNNSSNFLLGVSTSFNYRHKNLFKGAELFEFNITGGLETNFLKGKSFFTTVDVSTYANLYINKFLAPFKLSSLAKNYRPKTRFSIKYNFLRRIDYYTVNTTSLSYGYDWKRSLTQRHLFNLVNISLVRVREASAAFQEILARSQTLKNSFSEQLIVGSTYSYLWSNKALERPYGYFFFRGDLEIAGNTLHAINGLIHLKDDDALPYKIAGIPYAQFVQVAGDIRNYLDIKKHAKLVTRLYAGIGVPYGNSTGLPYIKQFFSGGADGVRAWRIRTLGPGSFVFEESSVSENVNFFYDQTGDIKLEGNMELRFDIFKFIKGALFVDAGNIWTLKADTLRPGANFEANRFLKEIALGTGIGFRMDFSYFVLRFDMAIPLRDPGVPGDRWVIRDFDISSKAWRKENLKFNLAIGYPF